MILTLLFWVTPVFYKSRTVDQRYQFLFDFNPVAVLIHGYRDVLFYAQVPELWGFLYAIAISILIGVLGYLAYIRHLHNVVDAL